MNRSKLLKTALAVFVFVILFVLAAGTAFAVPAPGAAGKGSGACRSHYGSLVTLDDIPVRSAGAFCAPSVAPVNKSIPLITVVIGFSNVPYEDGFNWADTIFSGPKSLAAYYTDMSFGKFTFTPAPETSAFGVGDNTNEADAPNDGVVHVKLSSEHKDWANEDEYPALAQAIIAALEAADPYVDFSAFDADENGVIGTNELAVGFVFAGYEGSASYTYPLGIEKYLWAHAWSVGGIISEYNCDFSVPAPDGVHVDEYISIAEQMDESTQEPISVLAHELGHYLGLPDLYDTSVYPSPKWNKYDVSDYSVMAQGSWGIDPDGGYIPYSMDVWSRCALGWCEPVTADGDGDYTVTAQSYTAEDAFSAVCIPTQREGEYYLLENRQFVKWDAGLSLGHDAGGIILWHVDDAVFEQYNEANQVNDSFHRPGVMPLYPELAKGAYTFIGNAAKVLTGKPFFSASFWASLFGENAAPLDLPLYGSGDAADNRAARLLSGLKVGFSDDCAPQMTVRFSAADHVEFLEETPGTAPTCTEPGRASYWTCGYCGAAYLDAAGTVPLADPESLVIPAGHDFDAGIAANVLTVFSASTCQTPGSGIVKCSRCDATAAVELPLNPENHEYGAWETVTPSTCVTLGSEKRVCPCGAQESRLLTALDPENHEFGAWETVTPSTCTVYGSEKRVCPCGAEESRQASLDPENNVFGEWATITAPTCHTEGLLMRTCACGAAEEKTLEKDPAAHDGGTELRNVVPATCTEAGWSGDICCAGCGALLVSGGRVRAAGHSWGEWTPDGETALVRTCSVCGAAETCEVIRPGEDEKCRWCGEYHVSGLMQRLIGFFHKIFYFFAHIAGVR